MIAESPALEMRNITKQFPGVRALDGVSLVVQPGEVHALLGENGAGKSTLMKILAGAQPMDTGEILLNGKQVHIDSPQKAMSLGISIIYQEFNLAPTLSVGENIFLGREPIGKVPGLVNFRKLYRDAQELISHLGVPMDVRSPVSRLSVAQQQMVEIAKATSRNSRIIVMDEPSATLTDHELSALFELIRKLKAQGVSIIYISHRLEEVFQVCDTATIMRDGRHIVTKPVSELTRDDIVKYMVGRELTEAIPKESAPIGDVALEVKGLNRKNVLHDINFSIHKGEIVGLAGLVGSGRTETARAVFGADTIDSGEIRVNGKAVKIRSPREAIKYGIGLVTEDRKQQGLILSMPVRHNTSMANLQVLSKFGFLSVTDERRVAEKYRAELSTKTPSVEQTVKNLSGGNQQKVVLSKWLFSGSRILIFDEPTRGIDVGAKSEIYKLMNQLAASGVAILMISSELPEVLGMSDRILVMHEGHIAGELSRAQASQEAIMQLATGGQ